MQKRFALGAKQTIAVGFAIIILVGGILLMLPISNRSGESIPFLNALFTAASATCVTGLVVYDTWSQFSFFGQFVILILIQIGALGFMTIAILFSMVLRRRIGLKERTYLMEAVNSMQISGVVRLVQHILIGTFIFEGIGAAILAYSFYPVFGLKKGIWYGIFHSVSAFCNAGFDLMGTLEPYTSLVPFVSDPVVNITIMALIVIGGIGFIVWKDIMAHKGHFKQYNLHTKVVLASTAGLILVSAVVLFFLERNHAFSHLNFGDQILASFFQAVTPRTAGFNTVDNGALSEGGSLITMLLMFIGGGPGSTAGGIKVTTFVLLITSIIASSRRQEDITLFNRRIHEGQVRRAYSNTALYALLAFSGCMVLLAMQSFSLKEALFETLSALGTVGLSTGITRDLNSISRLAIILLMYSGRLGSLTLFMAVAEKRQRKPLRDPEEKIIIG
ncbi:Trk family potassium uptake protein [Alkalibacter rhizosphaerae]|uniref:Trk family potassium uptake protein n=1 Tax=Alkalibacter rhizosphaerae TaxID=2815577 RepID=A0A974XGW1_9FIRM|nr:TrkH family potassium uptake protein [Alkalibacter rhizosphaerae]QSX09583.1 Trk family potassium uptake protein [Alkalibacter rhizosphaerae]